MAGFVLASGSPRRLELLSQIGIKPSVVVSPDIDESVLGGERPRAYALRMAAVKLTAASGLYPESFCLAADTVVACGLRILGKPRDATEAGQYLRLLSGRRHRVLTAFAVQPPTDERPILRLSVSSVKMKRLNSSEIDDYLGLGEWQGKAGGYAIQGHAARYISWIEGSYSGIVGLPVFELSQVLTGLGYRFDG